jgi:hypothetical protein
MRIKKDFDIRSQNFREGREVFMTSALTKLPKFQIQPSNCKDLPDSGRSVYV